VDTIAGFLEQQGLSKDMEPSLTVFAKNLKISRSSCKLLKFNVEDILALP